MGQKPSSSQQMLLDARLSAQAAGHAAEELRNKYDSWVKHRKGMVASLTHGVLKEMLGSMVLLIGVEHKPCRTPCFQVSTGVPQYW
jgi:hypothetical protein